MKTRAYSALSLAFVLAASGCSSMVNGTRQAIPVNTTPAGANVLVHCGTTRNAIAEPVVTPSTVELRRRTQPCLITLQKEGYEDTSIVFARKVSGWVWGNLVFGGIVGWAIDGMSGGMFYKVPETVQVELRETPAKSAATENGSEEE
jgi:hypothetical protein